MEVIKETDIMKIIKLDIEIANSNHFTNTYIIIDKTKNICMVIDPAYDAKRIYNVITGEKSELKYIVITHGHADHMGAIEELEEIHNNTLPVYIHSLDKVGLTDSNVNEQAKVSSNIQKLENVKVIELNDKDVIQLENIILEVIHTPGHTKGSICLYDKSNNILFSGDTIFHNTYGRTDLYWSDKDRMKESLDKIFNRFEAIDVLPGHDKIFNLKDSKKRIRLVFAFKE